MTENSREISKIPEISRNQFGSTKANDTQVSRRKKVKGILNFMCKACGCFILVIPLEKGESKTFSSNLYRDSRKIHDNRLLCAK